MTEVWYEEMNNAAVLKTQSDTEWLKSDSIVRLSDWN